ncbi:MAG: DNA polymerase Y family protein [Proteobacteria bacterium]|nr:DNA polymerase Y family protein [Pseudomonadota bacterium]
MQRLAVDRLACVDLHIGDAQLDHWESGVVERLRRFSPDVEPSEDTPGIFWLRATGLDRLYSSLENWAEAIRADLLECGYCATSVIGFTRFGTYALARSGQGAIVLSCPEQEAFKVRKVPLNRLELSLSALDGLAKLGKRNVGDLLDLPVTGLLERFGSEIYRLCQLVAGDMWDPLQPVPEEEPICERIDLDAPETNAVRLTFILKQMLGSLLKAVSLRYEKVTELEIALELYRKGCRIEQIRPAAPTLDEAQLIDLIRLRLESLDLPAGATEMAMTAHTMQAASKQLHLFPNCPRRDLAAANRAFARLRAEFGPDAVVRAVIREGHLPEARFVLEPMESLRLPAAETGASSLSLPREGEESCSVPFPAHEEGLGLRTLVRRVYVRPIPLQTRPVVGPRGCHLEGMGEAPATRVSGPYVVSGGWWAREVHREYHFAETEAGRILWVYFDKKRRCWFLHGEVG